MSTIQINHDERIEKDFLGSKQVPVHAYYVSKHCVQPPITSYPFEMTNPGISSARS